MYTAKAAKKGLSDLGKRIRTYRASRASRGRLWGRDRGATPGFETFVSRFAPDLFTPYYTIAYSNDGILLNHRILMLLHHIICLSYHNVFYYINGSISIMLYHDTFLIYYYVMLSRHCSYLTLHVAARLCSRDEARLWDSRPSLWGFRISRPT